MANPQRMRVVAELSGGRVHVSELARRLGMSRPLLYMHLDRLEKAGLVVGQLELSEDGKAMKYFELAPFELRLTAETIIGFGVRESDLVIAQVVLEEAGEFAVRTDLEPRLVRMVGNLHVHGRRLSACAWLAASAAEVR